MSRRAAWIAALVGAVVAAVITLPGLGTGTLWDNSETAYGEVSREVLLYHSAVVMHLNGAPWFVQPPLYFWIAAAFAKLFGVAPFALRLPSALATIAMGGVVGYAVARVASLRAAVLSTIVLSTSLMVAIVGRLAIMDALLDLAVCLAILAFYAGLRTRDEPVFGSPWLLAWVAMAFGVLAKGPIAVVATALVIVPWYLWERARNPGGARLPRPGAWLAAIAVFALIAVPWYVLLAGQAGSDSLGELLGHYSFGRYFGTIENQTGPPYYYAPVVILGFFPWFAFLPPALWKQWRQAAGASGGLARLVLLWAVVPFVFFSIAKTKLPNYIALEFPALAIAVGLWFDDVCAGIGRRTALGWTLLVPASLAGLAFAISVFVRDMHLTSDMQKVYGDLVLLGGLVFAGSVACFVLLLWERTARFAPYALAAAAASTLLVVAIVAEPHTEPFKPIPQLAAIIRGQRAGGDVVAIQGVAGANALVFYTAPRVETLDGAGEPGRDTPTDPRHAICSAQRAFVVTSARRPEPDPTYGRNRRELARSGNDVLYLYDGPPCTGAE